MPPKPRVKRTRQNAENQAPKKPSPVNQAAEKPPPVNQAAEKAAAANETDKKLGPPGPPATNTGPPQQNLGAANETSANETAAGDSVELDKKILMEFYKSYEPGFATNNKVQRDILSYKKQSKKAELINLIIAAEDKNKDLSALRKKELNDMRTRQVENLAKKKVSSDAIETASKGNWREMMYTAYKNQTGIDPRDYSKMDIDQKILLAFYRKEEPKSATKEKVDKVISIFKKKAQNGSEDWQEMMYKEFERQRKMDPRDYYKSLDFQVEQQQTTQQVDTQALSEHVGTVVPEPVTKEVNTTSNSQDFQRSQPPPGSPARKPGPPLKKPGNIVNYKIKRKKDIFQEFINENFDGIESEVLESVLERMNDKYSINDLIETLSSVKKRDKESFLREYDKDLKTLDVKYFESENRNFTEQIVKLKYGITLS